MLGVFFVQTYLGAIFSTTTTKTCLTENCLFFNLVEQNMFFLLPFISFGWEN
jgi:hypothetical protein